MKQNSSLHIAISTDCNYLHHAVTYMKSVTDNNLHHFKNIHFHILANNLNSNDIAVIKQNISCEDIVLTVYDISDIRSRLGVHVPPTISISAYGRLFLASLIDSSIDKVIYSDIDAINTASFSDLWSMDIKSNAIAGVLDDVSLTAKNNVGLSDDAPYINSGFILINLRYWREHGLEKQFLDFLWKHNGNVFHHDQGIINAVCNDSIKLLHPKYNMVSNFFTNKKFSIKPFHTPQEIEEGKSAPVFIHFTPGVVNRPWVRNCRHPYKNYYLKYREMTTFDISDMPYDNRPLRLRFLSFCYFNIPPLYRLVLTLRNKISNKI